MTIRQIAHDVCLKVRELAELLDLEGSTDDKSWPAEGFSCKQCLPSCDYEALDYKGVWNSDG